MMPMKKTGEMPMKERDLPIKSKRFKLFFTSALHSSLSIKLLIVFLWFVAILILFAYSVTPIRYDLSVGMVPTHTIAASRDIIDTLATQQKREEAASAITPTYFYQEGVTEIVVLKIDQTFAQFRTVKQYSDTLPQSGSDRKYSPEELAYARAMLTMLTLRDYQLITLLNTSQDALDLLDTSLRAAVINTMAGYISEGLEAEAIASIMQIVGFRTDTSLLQNVALPTLKACIQPNLLIDKTATDAAREIARQNVEPVVYKKGQNIVVKGEGRITKNQFQILSDLGLINDKPIDIQKYLGSALLILIITSCSIGLLVKFQRNIVADSKRLALFGALTVFVLVISVFARMINIYLAPAILGAMLLTATLGPETGIIGNISISVLVCLLFGTGAEMQATEIESIFAIILLSGNISALIIWNNPTRPRILLAGFTIACVNAIILLSSGFVAGKETDKILADITYCVSGSFISSFLCVAFQPMLEMMFNLATPTKLLELSNPEQPLLRRLMIEAPGTYHHSMIVANLAEASAEAADANPLLARVAGYYHDVGKLKRPLYFKENQVGDTNIHDNTDPKVSAAIVTAHVRDGVELAKAYRLPKEIISIISEHHGDTPVIYFFHKSQQLSNGTPIDINDFRYDGHPPTTKESAIIMLCDTIEAAVRSMQNPTPERIEDFIVRLIRGKLEDGQLASCPLTLRDIDSICAACINVLAGVFHERIEYPSIQSSMSTRNSSIHQPISSSNKSQTIIMDVNDNIFSQQYGITTRIPPPPSPLPVPMPVITPEQVVDPVAVKKVEPVQFDETVNIQTVEPKQFGEPNQIYTVMPSETLKPVRIDELIAHQLTDIPSKEINIDDKHAT
jgi:cyclic-di-AMP phosphodiesterase PgpH